MGKVWSRFSVIAGKMPCVSSASSRAAHCKSVSFLDPPPKSLHSCFPNASCPSTRSTCFVAGHTVYTRTDAPAHGCGCPNVHAGDPHIILHMCTGSEGTMDR